VGISSLAESRGFVWDVELSRTINVLQECLEIVANEERAGLQVVVRHIVVKNDTCGSIKNTLHVQATDIENGGNLPEGV